MSTNDNDVLSHSNSRVVTWGVPDRVAFMRQVRINLFGLRFAFLFKIYRWESSNG